MNLKRRWLMLLAGLPLLAACKEDDGLSTPPIVLPFAVHKAGAKIAADFRVKEQKKYGFDLRFRFTNPVDRKRVAKLVGHPKDKGSGIPIPLRIRVTRIAPTQETVILNREVSDTDISSHGRDSFTKSLISLYISRGHYRVVTESLNDIPELQGIQIEFAIVRAYVGK